MTVAPLVAISVGDDIEITFETCPDGSIGLVGEC